VSLYKRCSADEPAMLKDGTRNPLRCAGSPKCDHHWWYDFRVNGRRYRATTETSNKNQAKAIEAKERSRILEGKHQIRRQPDVTFSQAAREYLDLYAIPHNKSPQRAKEAIEVLKREFGGMLLTQITPFTIEAWKAKRLAGTYRGHGQKSAPKPVQPATVNRELNVLSAILAKQVEWKKLVESPARQVPRLKVENTRTRILSEAEEDRLLAALPLQARRITQVALLTGARIGEVLGLTWDEVTATELTFRHTKNGTARSVPMTETLRQLLATVRRRGTFVFMSRPGRRRPTATRYTPNGFRHTFRRAVERAGLDGDKVTPHTLRHTVLSRMVAAGHDDFTVMSISGHRSTRMLQRYAHPQQAHRLAAMESVTRRSVTKVPENLDTNRSQGADEAALDDAESSDLLGKCGAQYWIRTSDPRRVKAVLYR
jgi:integrase